MTGTRIRLVALTAPLVAGLVLGVAAVQAASGGAPAPVPDDLDPVATLPTVVTPSVFVLPRTTPAPAPAVEAPTGPVPAPRPEPARTAPPPHDES